jgi:elongation factor P--beta-lysine ligase
MNSRPPPSSARLGRTTPSGGARGCGSSLDERLLAALTTDPCTASSDDRTLMLASGAAHIDEVLAFPTARA